MNDENHNNKKTVIFEEKKKKLNKDEEKNYSDIDCFKCQGKGEKKKKICKKCKGSGKMKNCKEIQIIDFLIEKKLSHLFTDVKNKIYNIYF